MNTGVSRAIMGVILSLYVVMSIFTPCTLLAQTQLFVLYSYSYKSSAGTEEIYPGSRNVVLTVNVLYNGDSPIYVSTGCIGLPRGFTATRGYSVCAAPQTPNETTYETIYPGDLIVFTYHVDISRDVNPGTYSANLTIYYREGVSGSETLGGIEIVVSSFPELSLQVVDWYWSPAGYPGSENVYLYLTIKNTGNSRIVEADGVARFNEDFFTPPALRFQISNLGRNEFTTLPLGPISIYPSAQPGTSYPVILEINATMSTDDGVDYYEQGTLSINVVPESSPTIKLEVVDYGLETPKPVQGSRQARFYVVFVNKDFKTARSITAYFTVTSPGVMFVNGTAVSVAVYQGVVNYGNVISLHSDPLIVSNTSYMDIEVRLVVFGDDNGAEFWSTLNYYFRVQLMQPAIDLEVSSAYWPLGEVYPGTERTSLNIVLVNRDVVDVRDAVITIYLPQGFYPGQFTVGDVVIQRGSITTVSFTGISLSSTLSPGEYPVHVAIQGVALDPLTNTYYAFTLNSTVLAAVSKTPRLQLFALTSAGWVGEKAYTTSVNAAFYSYFQVVAPGHVVGALRVTAILPSQMVFTTGERTRVVTLTGTYRYGDYIYVEFSGVNVVADRGGYYPVVIRVEGLATGTGEHWFTEDYTILLPVLEPSLEIVLVDAHWTSCPMSGETSGAGFRVVFQSRSLDTINSLAVKATLLNAVFNDGRSSFTVAIQGAINYGEIFALEFSGVEINTTAIQAVIEVSAVLAKGRETYYRALGTFTITLKALEELKAFRIIAVHTTSRGEYVPLLPSSRGITISIELVNSKPYQVAWVQVNVTPPQDFKVNDIAGTCSSGVVAGGTCTISIDVDVAPEATPGIRVVELALNYAVRTGQGLAVFVEKHSVSLFVADYKYYEPRLALISAYWGVQAPTRALTGQRNVPLTIAILNTGYYPVDGLYVEAKPLNDSVVMVVNSSMCTPRLATGASCSVVLYADISGVEATGIVLFEIAAKYTFTLYNTLIEGTQLYTVNLPVEEAASGKGLLVIDASWSNNWPVYPRTENATFQVTLANRWPYRVLGVQLELELPPGLYSKAGSIAQAYIPGPINTLQVFTGQFTVSIGDIRPGVYTAKLKASYVVETGIPHARVLEEHDIVLIINNPENSVQVINVNWVGKAPEPPEYGVVLEIAVRNNGNPAMKGAFLDLFLPEGFMASDTNTSRIKVPASSLSVAQQLQARVSGLTGLQISPQAIQEALLQLVARESVFSYGDILYFYTRLNVLTEKRGVFKFVGNLNFVDHWNNVRNVPLEFNVSLLGSFKFIEVQAPVSLSVVKGTSTLALSIVNKGSAPVYNVYVYLVPYNAMLVPQDAVRYVDILPPGEPVVVNYALVYNPFAVATGGVQAYLRYMSVPFELALFYRDVYGYTSYYNTSLAVLLEPFIDISVTGVKASLTGKTLSISGTITNYGIATARSVVVRAIYSNYSSETLVGDLDPASQTAFRLELETGGFVEDNVVLVVSYRDEYGRIEELNYTIRVTRVEPAATTTPAPRAGEPYTGYLIVSVAVVAFLSIVAFMLYRYLKAHGRRGH